MSAVTAPLTFQSRDMLAALHEIKPVKRAILDTFFTRTETHNTDTIDLDVITDIRRMARFTDPREESTVVDRIGFTAKAFKVPYIKLKMAFTADQFMRRGPGESNYSALSPQDRIQAQMALDLNDLRNQIRRTEELMAVQQLTTGITTIVGNGVNATVTVGDSTWQSNHLVSPGTAWTNASGVPLDDLQSLRRRIVQDSGKNPNTLMFSNGAWSKFINNAQVKAQSNLFNYTFARGFTSANSELPSGLIYHGNVMGFDCYEYTEFYRNDSSWPTAGSETDMMTANTIIMGTTGARATKHYGVIQDIDNVTGAMTFNEVAYWPKMWSEPDPSVRWISVQSAPLPLAEEINAFGCLTVA